MLLSKTFKTGFSIVVITCVSSNIAVAASCDAIAQNGFQNTFIYKLGLTKEEFQTSNYCNELEKSTNAGATAVINGVPVRGSFAKSLYNSQCGAQSSSSSLSIDEQSFIREYDDGALNAYVRCQEINSRQQSVRVEYTTIGVQGVEMQIGGNNIGIPDDAFAYVDASSGFKCQNRTDNSGAATRIDLSINPIHNINPIVVTCSRDSGNRKNGTIKVTSNKWGNDSGAEIVLNLGPLDPPDIPEQELYELEITYEFGGPCKSTGVQKVVAPGTGCDAGWTQTVRACQEQYSIGQCVLSRAPDGKTCLISARRVYQDNNDDWSPSAGPSRKKAVAHQQSAVMSCEISDEKWRLKQ